MLYREAAKNLKKLAALLAIICGSCYATVPDWTWISNANAPDENFGTQGVPSPQNQVAPRWGNSFWSDHSGNLWVLGGYGYSNQGGTGEKNDLWRYSIADGLWTWMKGGTTLDAPSVYGALGVADDANTPGARHESASWSDSLGNLWLFGGTNTTYRFNDLWKFQPGTNAWTWIKGSQFPDQPSNYGTRGQESVDRIPGARSAASTWTALDGTVWLFGGYGYASDNQPGWLNDLWKYNPATGNWTWMHGTQQINQAGVYGTQGLGAAGNTPGARQNAATWVDSGNNLWMFGGYIGANGAELFSDLWRYSLLTNTWTWVAGSNTSNQTGVYGTPGVPAAANHPGARFGSGTWVDQDGRFLLFGGTGYSTSTLGSLNDLWAFDASTLNWVWEKGSNGVNAPGVFGTRGVPSPGNTPSARYDACSLTDVLGNHWLFAGNSNTLFNVGGAKDLWKLSSTIPLTGGTASFSEKLQEKLVCTSGCGEVQSGSFQMKCAFQLPGTFVSNIGPDTNVIVRIGNLVVTNRLGNDPKFTAGATKASLTQTGNVSGKQKTVLSEKLTWSNGALKLQMKGLTPAILSPIAATMVDGPTGGRLAGVDVVVEFKNPDSTITRFARIGLPLSGNQTRASKVVAPTTYHLDKISLSGSGTAAP
jgi:N-acetylneuraminic acid mutarotase